MRHHTATHLLHAALRARLGAHVHQAGSLVSPDRLRFDFSHSQPLTPDQRRAVQRQVNESITCNWQVRTDVLPLEEATRSGAIALFDERYGDLARVVTIGADGEVVSKELCGGTHAARTGDLGFFVLTGESSIGSGVRRVEALAGPAAEEYVSRQLEQLDDVARTLGARREDAAARARQVLDDLAAQRRKTEAAARATTQDALASLLPQAQEVAGPAGSFKLLAAQVDPSLAPSLDRLRELADWLRDKLGGRTVLLLVSVAEGKPLLLCTVSKELNEEGLLAPKLFKVLADAVGGRGGGRPDLAQGGGGDPARIAGGLEQAAEAARAASAGG